MDQDVNPDDEDYDNSNSDNNSATTNDGEEEVDGVESRELVVTGRYENIAEFLQQFEPQILEMMEIIGNEDDENDENNDDNDDDDDDDDNDDDEGNNNEENNNNDDHSIFDTGEPISFDITLSTNHTYLGNLDEVSGRKVLLPGERFVIPIFALYDLVLFPGNTIPMKLFSQSSIQMIFWLMNESGDTKSMFGVVCRKYQYLDYTVPNNTGGMCEIGTTASIVSLRQEINSSSNEGEGGCLVFVARGRHKFRIINKWYNNSHECFYADVEILGEGPTCPPKEMVNNMSWWPQWVSNMYDPNILMNRLKMKLPLFINKMNESEGSQEIPLDPLTFSFWLSCNLPLPVSKRQCLLEASSVSQRLRMILFIKDIGVVKCRCNQIIANESDFFPMNIEGFCGAYVNPNGFVHEVLTLKRAVGIVAYGPQTIEESWFPGYGVRMIRCRRCRNHLGWRYDRVIPNIIPTFFWGIRLACLHP